MATTYTPNLDLPKHAITDPFDITLINEAMDKTDAAVAGKAPAGYGLGAEATELVASDDLDNETNNGWYRWGNSVPANAPVMNNYGGRGYGYMRVDNSTASNCIQTVYTCYSGMENCRQMRAKIGGVWKPWEWVNPPMMLGVEYRTTERWNGKVVYTKAISVGAAAEGNYVVNDTSSAGVTRVLRYCGSLGTNALPLPEYSTWLRVGDNGGQLSVVVNIGDSAFVGTAVYAQAWYTKD